MLFNSGVFLQFFAGFLLLYFLVRRSLRARNGLIVLGSYLFYGWWDYRLLSLILFSSLLDYGIGLAIAAVRSDSRKKGLLTLSMIGNLGILGFFKYYDFFVQSLESLLLEMGLPFDLRTLNLVLPVGISFYTFQSMSYTIDVYRGQIQPTRALIPFLAYVAFFPQLVAGPIERARHLLPQFFQTLPITRHMVTEGIWLSIWGMFKKVVIADNLAPLVDMVYSNPAPAGPMVALATVAFGFQIYCDFSGYSDIARGTAKCLGFDIMLNFNLPYAARNLREFWRRWHISLTSWLRDYLYIPLGGNRLGPIRNQVNLLVTMLLGGLWHGAAWNFLFWGLWHGLGLMVYRLWNRKVGPARRQTGALLAWTITMLFVLYGWLLFRAQSLDQVILLTQALGRFSFPIWTGSFVLNLVIFIVPLIAMQLWQARTCDLMAPLKLPGWLRACLQGVLLTAILWFWEKEKIPFIYFQF